MIHKPAYAVGLFDYQVTGVDFLVRKTLASDGEEIGAGLWDEQGTGKTIMAIRACDFLSAERILVICPQVARINWQREFSAFSLRDHECELVLKGTQKLGERSKNKPHVTIVSRDMVKAPALKNQLEFRSHDVVIVDEAHDFKNRTAARTKALYGEKTDRFGSVTQRADAVWNLTGTPTPNNASELWTHLKAIAPRRIGASAYGAFMRQYTYGRQTDYGWQIMGNRNTEELKQRLDGFFIRRKKADVLKDLPPLVYSEMAVEPDPKHLKELKAIYPDIDFDRINAVLAGALQETGRGDELPPELQKILNTTAMATLRRLVGLLKVSPVSEIVKAEAEDPEYKVILFAHHKEVIAALAQNLEALNPQVITGDTRPNQRQEAIDRFQNDPKARCFIGQTDACNSAITLTAAQNVLLVEPSWVPAINAQAVARAHRIGQPSSVLARFVKLAGTLDEALIAVIRRKTEAIAKLID